MKMTENLADSNDSRILLKWEVIIKCYKGRKTSKSAT